MKTITTTALRVLWVGLGLGLVGCASQPYEISAAQSATLATSEADPYASKAIANEEWTRAASILEAIEGEDPLVLLNLAHVYAKSGDREQAIGVYQRVLAHETNPYADIGDRAPLRVKTIAELKLSLLQAGQ